MMGRDSKMPCFAVGVVQTTHNLRQRFQLQLSADEAEQYVETDLIGKSLGSYYTRLYVSFRLLLHSAWIFCLAWLWKCADRVSCRYDTYQYRTQGIY